MTQGKFIKPKGAALRLFILTLASRPQGFSLKYDKGDREPKPMETVCVWLVSHGEIIKAKHNFEKRYFTKQADAVKFSTQRQPTRTTKTTTKPETTRFAATVEIVYPTSYRLTVIKTPPPRFVAFERLAFQH